MSISSFEQCAQSNKSCFLQIASYCTWQDQEAVLNASTKVHNAVGKKIYANLCNDRASEIRSLLNRKAQSLTNYQKTLVTETYCLILKHCHFSNEKRYHCLRALATSLSDCPSRLISPDYDSDDEENNEKNDVVASFFGMISMADIPHFILTRCWEIMILSGNRSGDGFHQFQFSLEFGGFLPFTERSFKALVQAYKNCALMRDRRVRNVSWPCLNLPYLIFTKGNKPQWVQTRREQDEVSRNLAILLPELAPSNSKMFKCINLRWLSTDELRAFHSAFNKELMLKNRLIAEGTDTFRN
ncbi:MAG TPA: hypothetical protein VLG76_06050 [Rhabdochlamydiaceae bacterium]|nr:hypothetical protein [Rhabdochlamydiaceae bacterium]